MTPLNYALLGLIRDEPRTGYALRKVFEATPMGNYSSSPGSIYPALKVLVKATLIEGGDKAPYVITAAGRKAFNHWLLQPMAENEPIHMALLRFAFLHDHPDKQVSLDFLKSFAMAAKARVTGLKAFMSSDLWHDMPLQSRLAVEHGVRTTEASAEWALDAWRQLQRSSGNDIGKVTKS